MRLNLLYLVTQSQLASLTIFYHLLITQMHILKSVGNRSISIQPSTSYWLQLIKPVRFLVSLFRFVHQYDLFRHLRNSRRRTTWKWIMMNMYYTERRSKTLAWARIINRNEYFRKGRKASHRPHYEIVIRRQHYIICMAHLMLSRKMSNRAVRFAVLRGHIVCMHAYEIMIYDVSPHFANLFIRTLVCQTHFIIPFKPLF